MTTPADSEDSGPRESAWETERLPVPPPAPIAVGPVESSSSSLLSMRRAPSGSVPGTLTIPPDALPVQMRVVTYSNERIDEATLVSPMEIKERIHPDRVMWLDVTGFGDGSELASVGELLGIHPLAVADIVHTPQRSKCEAFGDRYLVVMQMGSLTSSQDIELEQITLVLGPTWVVTFQERPGDIFEPVRLRLRGDLGSLRRAGPDYLAYALIDAIVDGYFPILEQLGERLDDLEEAALTTTDHTHLHNIHAIRRLLIQLNRICWGQRDVLGSVLRTEEGPFGKAVHLYLRDTYDHSVQLLELVGTLRELATAILEVHLSTVNTRMNEVMKTLTVMASIFIPLTFLAGVYGMNFRHMPELGWRWSYAAFWLTILSIAGALLYWFRRRGWLRGD